MTFLSLYTSILSLLLLLHVKPSISDPRATEAATICSNRTAPETSREAHLSNFLGAMDTLTIQVYNQRYGVASNSTRNDTVYAYAECMRDLSRNDCNFCFARAKTLTTVCRPIYKMTKGGILFYDGCFLRYDDYLFLNETLSPYDTTVCGKDDYVGNKGLFRRSVMELGRNMSVEGPRNDGFSTGSVMKGNLTVYGLAQCWKFVNGSRCVDCLRNAVSRIGSCAPKVEGRSLNAGCYVRYSTTRFYNMSASDDTPTGGGGSNRRAAIIASACGASAFLFFATMIALFARKRILRRRQEKKKFGALLEVVKKSKTNFSYETLEKATNYFHESTILGQGGSGTVHKGILPGGQVVAVKRLLFHTNQWADHFFNEINLISGIDHKNLVKLLGCSITGPESLLVYEYITNESLHDYLFVKKNVPPLSWEERYRIILGTAEGLAYLHEESRVRIIHRDIKLSNVLLDEDFTPKIADFGLARLFPEDKSHVSTAIAGTLGYMAPEYIVRGKLTEKADVYSFGVLVIEVVCGTKNYAFTQNSYSILQKVWNLYGMGKLSEVVDTSIKGTFPEIEANNLLQIGLTCVQADPELRPSMPLVVKMITGVNAIAHPSQPPFLSPVSSEFGPRIIQPSPQQYGGTQSSGNEITENFTIPR